MIYYAVDLMNNADNKVADQYDALKVRECLSSYWLICTIKYF